ncbi:hypothetical protein FH972_026020 [Carpinus fangiana]|uniref:Telomere length regulation protein conserved domain-containing protein n=1 Tax=Carpinus fangiana TaxID=176857 RepID=A0A5N6L3P7_9ROSI|nr:hypothetical protein FH972_026020 [Carpinus fangiana]
MSDLIREISSSVTKLNALLEEPRKDLQQIQRLRTTLTEILNNFWTAPDTGLLNEDKTVSNGVVNLIASTRIVTVAARAESSLSLANAATDTSWIANGRLYARWLGAGTGSIIRGLSTADQSTDLSVLASLVGKSLNFGYAGVMRVKFFSPINSGDSNNQFAIRTCAALLQLLFNALDPDDVAHALSALLRTTSGCSQLLKAILFAATPSQQDMMMERSWQQFSDPLNVLHSPAAQQETVTQCLCLSIGLVHRRDPMRIFLLARSGMHTAGISAHLKSSNPQIRFLGMATGNTISKMVDVPGNRMSFQFDGDEQRQAALLQALAETDCHVGRVHDLTVLRHHGEQTRPLSGPPPKILVLESGQANGDTQSMANSILDIEEDNVDLLTRQRYIRELIAGLQDTDKFEQFRACMETGPDLVRRKANLGYEVRDHADDLAAILLNIRDPFGITGFDEHRKKSMLALLVAEHKRVGPLYAFAYFNGDYTVVQRIDILHVLAAGADSMVGNAESSHRLTAKFSEKALSGRLHHLYLDTHEDSAQPTSGRSRSNMEVITQDIFFPLLRQGQIYGRNRSEHHFQCLSRTNIDVTRIQTDASLLPVYLHTLSVILSASGPITINMDQAIKEYWQYLLYVRALAGVDSAIVESILLGLLAVLNINGNKRRLAEDHARELLETHEWAEMIFEASNDSTRTLAAAVLVATKDTIAIYNRLLMGDMIGM